MTNWVGRTVARPCHLVYGAWSRVLRTLDFKEAMTAYERSALFQSVNSSRERTYLPGIVIK